MIKKPLIALALAAGLALAAPAAAEAADYGTPPVNPGAIVHMTLSLDTTVSSPQAVSINVAAFLDGIASVTANGPGRMTISAPTVTSTGTANVHSGVAAFSISPSVAGNYNVTLTQGANTASITIVVSSGLPSTGVNDPTPTFLIAGVAVLLGAGAIGGAVAARRRRVRTAA